MKDEKQTFVMDAAMQRAKELHDRARQMQMKIKSQNEQHQKVVEQTALLKKRIKEQQLDSILPAKNRK